MYRFYELHQYELGLIRNHREVKYGRHMHGEFEVIYLFDGEQGIIVNDLEYTLHKGDCAVIFPNLPHEYTKPHFVKKYNNAADCAIIFIPAAAVYSMFPDTHASYPDNCFVGADIMHENAVLAFDKIFEETTINAQIGWAYIILSHTVPVLMKRSLSEEQDADVISRLLSYISLNFKKSLTLDIISEELGINKYYISRIFSKRIKMNFRTYIGTLRANYAAELIKISDDNLEDIAEEAGFESLRSFYRVFREIFNVTPSQYRDMIRKY